MVFQSRNHLLLRKTSLFCQANIYQEVVAEGFEIIF